MSNKPNDPINNVGVPNGKFFGLPFPTGDDAVVLVSVPWDATTSYRAGSSQGPKAILDASIQLDYYDHYLENAWEYLPSSYEYPVHIEDLNQKSRQDAEKVIAHLEKGGAETDAEIQDYLSSVNQASKTMNAWLEDLCDDLLESGKIPCVVGGDHSSPIGLMKSLAKKHSSFAILHIDAHADLRIAYEGFVHSHASIMHHALQLKSVSGLVQIGIRDVSPFEAGRIKQSSEIKAFWDQEIHRQFAEGKTWSKIVQEILSHLPDKIYISLDIDGLDPALCPDTGTPVPGGISFNECLHLLRAMHQAGKQIIGFDLCEVAPGQNEINAITGARMLHQLAILTKASQKNNS